MQIKNRQQMLTAGAIAILALFAADRLLIDPLTGIWDAKAKQIRQMRAQLAENKAILRREQAIRVRWSQMERNTLTNNASAAEQQLFAAIDSWRRDSGVAINGATPAWKHDADDYMTYQCRMDASGNLATVSKFLYDLEKDPMALRLDSIEINARDKEGQVLVLGLQISGLVLTPQTR
ncbi:MAG: hypothetical protein ACREIC_27185 [Limisphaerales bacterium]